MEGPSFWWARVRAVKRPSPGVSASTIAASVMLLSCATTPPSDLYAFRALDSDNSSKLFVYETIPGKTSGESARPTSQRPGAGNYAEMRRQLEGDPRVGQYCQMGYFIYGETFDGRTYSLLGECQESK